MISDLLLVLLLQYLDIDFTQLLLLLLANLIGVVGLQVQGVDLAYLLLHLQNLGFESKHVKVVSAYRVLLCQY